ncbi:hypothetical protein [Propionivibrio sp.]|uniref:hypothetical protein n=1 Tax=Propionivibrio sp. TaxID=2212460 RepID=UPI003BF28BFC
MSHQQQHDQLCNIFSRLVPVLDCDDLETLAGSCGVSVADFYYPTEIQRNYYLGRMHDAADAARHQQLEATPF